MTPYYEQDGIVIYHGDCREVLSSVHSTVLITDPPYGTGYYATDTAILTAELLGEWVQRFITIAIFGWPEWLIGLMRDTPQPTEWVTWWPSNAALKGGPHMHGLRRECEVVAIWGEIAPKQVTGRPRQSASVVALSLSRHDGPTAVVGDVWTDPSPGIGFNSDLRLHPNEKPLGVMQRLVQLSAMGCVVDPFMGSGTTLVAAKRLGRKAIGIELEEKYCEIAAKRLAQGALDLFGESA